VSTTIQILDPLFLPGGPAQPFRSREQAALVDGLGRAITDLRISVTDRCNFRCVYCRSANPENHIAEDHLLSWDELARLARILVGLGIRKIRVTGGEPLVRPGIVEFISRLRALGIADLAMTTNGHRLAARCEALVAAGLDRVNISLDSLVRAKFEKITRTQTFDSVLAGIDAAQASALRPVKVNAVLVRGINDDEVEAFAEFARDRDLVMRFIEYMPLDADRNWHRGLVVTADEVYRRITARWELEPLAYNPGETARRYRFAEGRGEIGLVSPVSQPFCGHCSRIRLTADGKLRTCLFSRDDHDLRALLRGNADDAEIADRIREIVHHKERGHRINEPDFAPPSRSMVFIGG
jgi:cyclic pyranopterin phosphate synthase